MNYTVEWLTEAEDQLAEIWLQASDPKAVTASQAEIDRRLARDPTGCGQLLHEGLAKIVVPPLTAFYAVDAARRLVEVSGVAYTSESP
jgi:ethanolamine utilization microcompartment shell protein EutL